MSAKKQWTGQEKLSIVLQGLKGECSVGTLCNEHGITQGMYYKWRDQLFADGAKIFAHGGVDHEKERLQHESRKLKETIGELTIELKKTIGDAAQKIDPSQRESADAHSGVESRTSLLGLPTRLVVSEVLSETPGQPEADLPFDEGLQPAGSQEQTASCTAKSQNTQAAHKRTEPFLGN